MAEEAVNPEPGTVMDEAAAVADVTKMLEQPAPEQESSPSSDEVVPDQLEQTVEEPTEETVEAEAEPLGETSLEDLAEAVGVSPDDLSAALRVPIKVNGKQAKVPLSEALGGYQKDADYRQKTEVLANTLKAHQVEKAKFEQEKTALLERLNSQITALESQTGDGAISDEHLNQLVREGRTDEYIQAMHLKQQRETALEAAKAARDQEHERTKAEQTAALQQWRSEQVNTLLESLPELKDQAKAQEFAGDVAKLMESTGFNENEVVQFMNFYDHRQALIVDKAIKYDKLVAGKSKLAEKLKGKAKVLKPGSSPGRRQSADNDLDEARNRFTKAARNPNLSKSQQDDAAADMVRRMLGR